MRRRARAAARRRRPARPPAAPGRRPRCRRSRRRRARGAGAASAATSVSSRNVAAADRGARHDAERHVARRRGAVRGRSLGGSGAPVCRPRVGEGPRDVEPPPGRGSRRPCRATARHPGRASPDQPSAMHRPVTNAIASSTTIDLRWSRAQPVERHDEARRVEGAHLDPGRAQAPPEPPAGLRQAAQPVVDEAHAHALARLRDEGVGELPPDGVVGEDVDLEVDAVAAPRMASSQAG